MRAQLILGPETRRPLLNGTGRLERARRAQISQIRTLFFERRVLQLDKTLANASRRQPDITQNGGRHPAGYDASVDTGTRQRQGDLAPKKPEAKTSIEMSIEGEN